MKRSELIAALTANTVDGAKLVIDGTPGIVQAVERESGDGLSFNVKLLYSQAVNMSVWKFVRCTPD